MKFGAVILQDAGCEDLDLDLDILEIQSLRSSVTRLRPLFPWNRNISKRFIC